GARFTWRTVTVVVAVTGVVTTPSLTASWKRKAVSAATLGVVRVVEALDGVFSVAIGEAGATCVHAKVSGSPSGSLPLPWRSTNVPSAALWSAPAEAVGG